MSQMRLPLAGPVRWVPLVVVVVLGSACGGGKPADVPAIPVSVSVLPAGGELAGWSQATDLEGYDADSLWEHINGQANFFIDYGFVRVDAAEYRHDDEASRWCWSSTRWAGRRAGGGDAAVMLGASRIDFSARSFFARSK